MNLLPEGCPLRPPCLGFFPMPSNGLAASLSDPVPKLAGTMALFFPGITVHVISVLLPETGSVEFHEFEAANPFDRLPGVEMGHDQAQRITVIGRERLAIVMGGKQDIVMP